MLTHTAGTIPGTHLPYALWVIENPANHHVDQAVIVVGDTVGLLRQIPAAPTSERALRELGAALVEAGQHIERLHHAADDRYDLRRERAEVD